MRRSPRRPRRARATFKAIYEAPSRRAPTRSSAVHVAGTLSGTIKSAQIARDMLPDREIHVVDSQGASMAEGILCSSARSSPRAGCPPRRSPRRSRIARDDLRIVRRRSRRSSTSRKAAGSAAPRPRSGRSCRSSRSSPSSDGVGRHRRSSRGPGRSRASAASSSSSSARSSGSRSSTRSAPTSRRSATEVVRARAASTRRRVVRPRRPVGRAAPGPGLRRGGGPLPALRRPARRRRRGVRHAARRTTGTGRVGERLRVGCPNVARRWTPRTRGPGHALYSHRLVTRRSPTTRRRPVGSSGRRPNPRRRRSRAGRHGGPSHP